MKIKHTTTTVLVLEVLRARGVDFLTRNDLAARTGRSVNRVHAALCHLRTHNCVDVVVQDGKGWWFALPPESDNRVYIREEIKPEYTKKPHTRKKRKPPPYT